jgi:hypothetical protein
MTCLKNLTRAGEHRTTSKEKRFEHTVYIAAPAAVTSF